MPVKGSTLRRERQRRDLPIDAVAHELRTDFLTLLREVEEALLVSDEVADVYMRALDRLRPSGEIVRRHYGRTD